MTTLSDKMSLSNEITDAIGAHGIWKMRLRTAVQMDDRSLDVAQICRDDACRFGQWLGALPAETRQQPQVREVALLHRAFHKAAGDVASLITAGQHDEAEASMQSGAFSDISGKLSLSLMQWKRAI